MFDEGPPVNIIDLARGLLPRVAGGDLASWGPWIAVLKAIFALPLDEVELADEVGPELILEADLSNELLQKALQDISPMTRAVLLLKFRENRRCKDIARDLQLSDRQVRRHLTRAYERLREAMID